MILGDSALERKWREIGYVRRRKKIRRRKRTQTIKGRRRKKIFLMQYSGRKIVEI